MSTGRNDPCPCGSGKKYKKCCGAAVQGSSDLKYDRIRQLDTEARELILRYAKKRFGDGVLEKAWEDFMFTDEISFNDSHPEADLFDRWFTFNWQPGDEQTIAELFLSEMGPRLDDGLRRFIDLVQDSAFSFLQTIETNPGNSLLMRDILRKREVQVRERSASTVLMPGQILYARVVEMDDIFFIMGCGGHVIPPTHLDFFLKLRSNLEKDKLLVSDSVATKVLLQLEDTLRGMYFRIADDLEKRKLEVRNTDGDPLAFCTLTYGIPSLEFAFRALKSLEQDVTKRTDEELLAGAERDKGGQLKSTVIHWLKGTRKFGGEGNTSLATITIKTSSLGVEANSEKRLKLIQKEIAKRLGTDALLVKTEIKSHEGLMKELEERKTPSRPPEERERDRVLRESPEVKELMKGMMEKHWESWPDIPLPALRGMTPRQASKDSVGRELLESVLLDFDSRNRLQEQESLRVDIAKLRQELGLETGRRE